MHTCTYTSQTYKDLSVYSNFQGVVLIFYNLDQGCAITIARRPGLLIFRVGLAKTKAVLARRATKLRSKYKMDRIHVQVNSNENYNRQSVCV